MIQQENFATAIQAYRSKFVREIDPFFAVHNSRIEPLPHQIDAVYNHMLRQNPTRFMIADSPGAGKTIMAGLFIKEKLARFEIRNCLIVTPGSLVEQWQDELKSKFDLDFKIWDDDQISKNNLFIASIDKLIRVEFEIPKLDLVIFDEAHKISATFYGKKFDATKRFRLSDRISKSTENLILLTATPHSGDETRFRCLLSLLDSDRFFQTSTNLSKESLDLHDIMLLRTKEDLIDSNGNSLFPPRQSTTIDYQLSPLEFELYEQVTDYVRDEFNRAQKLQDDRRNNIGFAMTILQRRLASSPEAIYKSLIRRAERLGQNSSDEIPDDIEENFATVSKSQIEKELEIETLENLADLADQVRKSGDDRKFNELDKFLENYTDKIIIFTEHRDTLDYLDLKISQPRLKIHGGMSGKERREIEKRFRTDPEYMILLATDAAGEGINLQSANLVINYDLPWNPNRLEQRFGRVHRIGQKNPCKLINLVANQTREGKVFLRLLEKLEQQRQTLGDKVFNVLGKIRFQNLSLEEVLRSFDEIPDSISIPDEKSERQFIPRIEIPAASEEILPIEVVEKIPFEILNENVEFESSEISEPMQIEIIREQIIDGIGKIFGESLRFNPTPPRDLPFNSTPIESESIDKIKSHRESDLNNEWDSIYKRLKSVMDSSEDTEDLERRIRLRDRQNDLQRQFRIESEVIGRFKVVPKKISPPDVESKKEIEIQAMELVMKIERDHGRFPIDVSDQNLGYDIRSIDSHGVEFLIEVKGRRPDAREVTVSRNELATALISSNYILAIVIIPDRVWYFRNPFNISIDESVINVSFDINRLIERSEIFFEN